jgi:hypothetical protein
MRRRVRKLEEENAALKREASCFLRAIKRRIEENDGLRRMLGDPVLRARVAGKIKERGGSEPRKRVTRATSRNQTARAQRRSQLKSEDF